MKSGGGALGLHVSHAVDDPFAQRIRAWRRSAGAVPGGFDAWLLLRGMRTLFLRVRQSSASALQIGRRFEIAAKRLGLNGWPAITHCQSLQAVRTQDHSRKLHDGSVDAS